MSMFAHPRRTDLACTAQKGAAAGSLAPLGQSPPSTRTASQWGPLNGVTPSHVGSGTIEALVAEANTALEEDPSQRRISGGSDESLGSKTAPDSLAAHLSDAKRALATNHGQAVRILTECVEAVRSSMEAQSKAIRQENSQLREELKGRSRALFGEELHQSEGQTSLEGEGADIPGALPSQASPAELRMKKYDSIDSSTPRLTSGDAGLKKYDSMDSTLRLATGDERSSTGGVSHQLSAATPGPPRPHNRRMSLFSMFSVADMFHGSPRQSEGVELGRHGARPSGMRTSRRTTMTNYRRSSIFSEAASVPMFADADKMKAKIRQSIAKPVYNVTDFYKETGTWQAVARSSVFEQLTLIVIALNAVWIGIDTDWNKSQLLWGAHPAFIVMENLFCLFFTFECCVRFMSFTHTCRALKDYWFLFDSFLVFSTIAETWVMTLVAAAIVAARDDATKSAPLDTDNSTLRVLRLLRISRVARMARIFRAVPELMIVTKGLAAAIRSVAVTLTMLTLIIYVFGLAFTSLASETGAIYASYFSGVLHSMNTLLLHGVFLEDIPEVFNSVGGESPILAGIFLLFVLMASFLMVNMLIGVMVETVHVVSMVEREQLSVNFTKDKLLTMLHSTNLDANRDNVISKAEFARLLQIPEAVRALQELGVDVVGLVDNTEYLFEKAAELSFPAFMDIVLQMRGSNKATVKDIVDLRKSMRNEMHQLKQMLNRRSGCGIPLLNDHHYHHHPPPHHHHHRFGGQSVIAETSLTEEMSLT